MDSNPNQSSQPFSSASMSVPPVQMNRLIQMHQHRSEHQNFMNQLKQSLEGFWNERVAEICDATSEVRGQHLLPLSRVKKIMKSDDQVKMISADTPMVLAKACELFIMELTLRSWMHTQENSRRTLQRDDVASAIIDEDLLLFLKEIVPMTSYQREAHYSQLMSNAGAVSVPTAYASSVAHSSYLMHMHGTNQPVGAAEGHLAPTNSRVDYPMSWHHNMNLAYQSRNLTTQPGGSSTVSPSPPTSTSEPNPFYGFK